MPCPFNVIHYDPVKKVISKCDFCQHRRKEGKPLACVSTCPTRALIYDEFDAIVASLRDRVAESIIKGTALRLGFLLGKS
jgi:anaerobic dimethyl sulfoxide reductase subunit B (iron-sulfur subunit)